MSTDIEYSETVYSDPVYADDIYSSCSDITYKGVVWAGIYVRDLDAAVNFYQYILGLPLLGRQPDYAHFDAGAGALLELFSGGCESFHPKDTSAQSAMFALRVDDLEAVEAELRQRGVRFTENAGSFENMRWATLVDLEGNCIEIKEFS